MASKTDAEAAAGWSLRKHLLLLITVSTLGLWLLSAAIMYFSAVSEGSRLLDRSLAETAVMLLRLTEHEILEHGPGLGTQLLQIEANPPPDELQFQIFEGNSAAYQSSRAVDRPLLPRSVQGYSWTRIHGERWRAFSAWNPSHTLQIQIAEPVSKRRDFYLQTLVNTGLLLVLLLPVSLTLTGFILRRSFRPLDACARDIAAREPGDLRAVQRHGMPSEVRPLLDALNRLLERVQHTLNLERRFTADAAHELRTPLSAIRASAQVLCGARNARERDLIAANLVASVDRGSRLIEQLLTLARVDAAATGQDWSDVDLRQVIENQCEAHASLADDRRQRITLNAQSVHVHGNRHLLEVLTRNLLDNAIRHCPAGSEIRISSAIDDGRGELCVSDDGPGIPPQQRAAVFERFHRILTTEASGSGLGLSIVSRIADLHGASVDILDGLDGRGTRIRVSFSIKPPPAASDATGPTHPGDDSDTSRH